MDLIEKLTILSDAAKYDAACTSSGVDRSPSPGGIGNSTACGICHSFAADGRCISLLKVLMSNACAYNCQYCVNRVTNDTPRATFTPGELADLTIQFYRRNYIEGLFLSSGILKDPDYTCERMIETLRILREEYRFFGYIHVKAIPGADPLLIRRMGLLADRMSVNIELPSETSLTTLAPNKKKSAILAPMGQIRTGIKENASDLIRYRHAPQFVPAGQSTQMIIGASPENDLQILRLTEAVGNGLRLNGRKDDVAAVHDDDRPGAPPVGGVDQRAAVPCVLDDPLDRSGFRADDGDDPIGGHHIAEPNVNQFHTPPHSMFWICSRIFSISDFISTTTFAMARFCALEPMVLVSRFISWIKKSSFFPMGPSLSKNSRN